MKALLGRYNAFDGRRILVAGSHDLALETALLAHAHGLDVAGLIEVRGEPQGSPALVAAVLAAQINIRCGVTITAAEGSINGVKRVTVSSGDTIICDTLCMAIGLVPSIELVDAMNGPRTLDNLRGGYVPAGEDGIAAVGKCAGLDDTGFDQIAYRMEWMQALAAVSPPETIVCQCEEVTRSDLLGVQPPNYLARPAPMAARSLATLLADGPANPDQIKRLTRAGMGACQGRRCRTQVAALLTAASGVAAPVATYRNPVRPVPLGVLADRDEPAALAAGWDVWFGIPTQWTPYADIGTDAEFASGLGGGNRHV